MTTFVYRNGKLVDKRYAPSKLKVTRLLMSLATLMPETRHMANGKITQVNQNIGKQQRQLAVLKSVMRVRHS